MVIPHCSVEGCCNECTTNPDSVGKLPIPKHKWPKDENIAKKWVDFMQISQNKFQPFKSSRICCLHFTHDSYDNFLEWQLGYVSRLRLNNDAVPSLRQCEKIMIDALKANGYMSKLSIGFKVYAIEMPSLKA